jgi:hypothetical protein
MAGSMERTSGFNGFPFILQKRREPEVPAADSSGFLIKDSLFGEKRVVRKPEKAN